MGQSSDLTNRNLVRLNVRVRLPHKSKPDNCTESHSVNEAGIRAKERVSTRGGLTGANIRNKVKVAHSNNEL